MKNISLLLFLFGLFVAQQSIAQQAGHVVLSDLYPTVGETIGLTYNPTVSSVAGENSISGKLHFIVKGNYQTSDLALKREGNLFKSSFVVPDSAMAFFIKLAGDQGWPAVPGWPSAGRGRRVPRRPAGRPRLSRSAPEFQATTGPPSRTLMIASSEFCTTAP